jgi:ubiquinone/menaquinone biosynthesis C-methylase UbiE
MQDQNASPSKSFKDLERAGWIAKAPEYDAWIGAVTAGAIDPLLDAVKISPGSLVLDVACGPGYAAAKATERGAFARGVDFAPTMVAEARRRFPEVPFAEGDAEDLPFEDGSFDAIVCAFGLLHMANPDRAIAEAFRALRPGGRYAYTVWATPDRHQFFELLMGSIKAHGSMDVPLPSAPPIFRLADPNESRRAMASAGFSEISVADVPLLWHCKNGEAVIDMIYKSTVRSALMLEYQTAEARERIHRAIVEGAERYRKGEDHTFAFPAVLVAGRKL